LGDQNHLLLIYKEEVIVLLFLGKLV